MEIENYNTNEAASFGELSSRAIQAFSPVTFQSVNYPWKVAQEKELNRFVDVMQESKSALYFKPEIWKYSQTEAQVIRGITEKVLSFTGRQFGKPIRPWMAPLAAVAMWRVVEALSAAMGKKNLSVFEIGPGSGYLGACLIERGHTYGAMDNTQGLYLWQNRLFGALAGKEFEETALYDELPANISKRVFHIPWWHYTKIGTASPVQPDVIVCDHTLGEISNLALRFILHTSKDMQDRGGQKFFVFNSIGNPLNNSFEKVQNLFAEFGYKLIVCSPFCAFVPAHSELSRFVEDPKPGIIESLRRKYHRSQNRPDTDEARKVLSLRGSIPMIGDTDTLLSGEDIIPLRAEEAAPDYEFLARSGAEVPCFDWNAHKKNKS